MLARRIYTGRCRLYGVRPLAGGMRWPLRGEGGREGARGGEKWRLRQRRQRRPRTCVGARTQYNTSRQRVSVCDCCSLRLVADRQPAPFFRPMCPLYVCVLRWPTVDAPRYVFLFSIYISYLPFWRRLAPSYTPFPGLFRGLSSLGIPFWQLRIEGDVFRF